MADARSKALGKLLRGWRKARGLASVDVPEEMKKLGLDLSYSHYTKLEGGARSLASASLDLREGLRYLFKVTINEWEKATGLYVPLEDPDPPSPAKLAAIRSAGCLEAHPKYLRFPVYGAAVAGDEDPDPLEDVTAFIAEEKLKAKGANPRNIVVYRVNGNCMVSAQARLIEKNIVDGDHVAVDTRRRPQVGDTVAAWRPADQKFVIKRYRVERESILLYLLSPGHPTLSLPHEDGVTIIGVVIWREG